ncbi:MAG: haloacid dehalogenase [Candidatus Cloacimonadota bacterium]|nr:MAG: haloacid dehalogenase [Candidatus Cloacimonadota bacterium]
MQLFFDFDGVILDSVSIRTKGFEEVLKNHDAQDVKKLIDYHILNGGISRYSKFKWFYKEVLNKELSEEKLSEYTNDFSNIMLRELTNKKYLIIETLDFLEKTFLSMPMHIVSGSDQDELRHLCKELDIEKYFNSIHGSPTEKTINIKNMLDQFDYDAEDTLMIGDSINDYQAAFDNGVYFCGFNQPSLKELKDSYYIDDFKSFEPHRVICNR